MLLSANAHKQRHGIVHIRISTHLANSGIIIKLLATKWKRRLNLSFVYCHAKSVINIDSDSSCRATTLDTEHSITIGFYRPQH
jgi:hypothetical protein